MSITNHEHVEQPIDMSLWVSYLTCFWIKISVKVLRARIYKFVESFNSIPTIEKLV